MCQSGCAKLYGMSLTVVALSVWEEVVLENRYHVCDTWLFGSFKR